MTAYMTRCVETTLVSGVMSINAFFPLPTWEVVLILVCWALVMIPDNIEIWL